MKTKIIITIAAVCVCGSVAHATAYWTGLAGDYEWTTAGNWSPGIPASHALILGGDASGAPFYTYNFPVIGAGDSVSIAYTSLNWHGGSYGLTVPAKLTVKDGGFFHNSAATVINRDLAVPANHYASKAEIYVTNGGQMVSSGIYMSHNAGSYCRIFISGQNSYLHTLGVDFGLGDNKIDIQTEGAHFFLTGDMTSAVAAWIAAGNIVGAGGTGQLAYNYNQTLPGLTAVYLVPEPATLALLALGGLALMRRK